MGHLELPLYKYRDHESNRTKSKDIKNFDEKLLDDHGELVSNYEIYCRMWIKS